MKYIYIILYFFHKIALFIYKWQDLFGSFFGSFFSGAIAIYIFYHQIEYDRKKQKESAKPFLMIFLPNECNQTVKKNKAFEYQVVNDSNKIAYELSVTTLIKIDNKDIPKKYPKECVYSSNDNSKVFYIKTFIPYLLPISTGTLTKASKSIYIYENTFDKDISLLPYISHKLYLEKRDRNSTNLNPIDFANEFYKHIEFTNIIIECQTSEHDKLTFEYQINKNLNDLYYKPHDLLWLEPISVK